MTRKISAIFVSLLFFIFVACENNNSDDSIIDMENEQREEGNEVNKEEESSPNNDQTDEVEENDTSAEIEQEGEILEEEKIIEEVYKNLEAAQQADLDGYMATLHTDSPYYESTRISMEEIFSIYELDYVIEEIEVMEISEQVAKVWLIQTTTKISGPDFNDNQIEIVNIMRKQGDEWKIYETEVWDVIYLGDINTDTSGEWFSNEFVDFEPADIYSLLVPMIDEINGNYPGDSLSLDTYEFMLEHPDLFPASTGESIEKAAQLINIDIEYRHLTKSLNRYTSTMYWDTAIVIDIFEEYLPEIDDFITYLYVDSGTGEGYELLYIGTLDIFANDHIEFMGVPTIYSGFPNVSGGYTNVIVIAASHIEKR
ncbi:hypothetical protein ACERII_12660 [Evansella sp. AB-rgal1]|uniref:hypothetical protein n=1 Tax=Evansella sp. AB-rgal1 TaxID=3242696 RepID=UPI00359CBD84